MITLNRSTESANAALNPKRFKARKRVIELINDIRTYFVPPIVGQDLTYQEKEKQAIAFKAELVTPTVYDDQYSFIWSEVGVSGSTVTEVADNIIFRANLFRVTVGPAIENLRMIANKDIDAATTESEIDGIIFALEEDVIAMQESGLE